MCIKCNHLQRAIHLWIGCLVGRLCREGKVVAQERTHMCIGSINGLLTSTSINCSSNANTVPFHALFITRVQSPHPCTHAGSH